MELEFSLSELNKKSPYELASLGDYSFKFVTDQGKQYTIGFIEDAMISDNGVYQFFIKTEDQFKTFPDNKVRQTIFVVLEDFFKNEGVVLDYICETDDNRQAARHRIFHKWYSSALDKDSYSMRDLHIRYEGIDFYSSVILRKDNPRYNAINNAVDKFLDDFKDKLL